MAHVMGIFFHLPEDPLFPQISKDALTGGVAIQSLIGRPGIPGHVPRVVDDPDAREIVALAELEIVGIVGGSDLEAAGAEGGIHMGVRDHGDIPFHQGQAHGFAHEVAESLVLGMNRHRGVPEHGLRTGGGHYNLAAPGQGIGDVVDAALLLLVLHFQVRQGGLAAGAPVDDVVPAIDQALFKKPDEDLPHRPGQALVHGEALPAPVHGGAHGLDLVQDLVPVFLAPLPDPAHKLLAAQLFA